MNKLKRLILFIVMTTLTFAGTEDGEAIHWKVVQKIMEEGFNNSHIMEDVWYMTDVFGHRLAKSSSFIAAAKWAKKKFVKSVVS